MKTTIKSIAVALAFCAAAFLTVSAIIESTAPDGSEKYIMRDYNGRIAVFARTSRRRYSMFSHPPCPAAKPSASTKE